MKKYCIATLICLLSFSLWAQKSTENNCPSYSFPFFEDFDDYGDDDWVQDCWTHMDQNHDYPKMSNEQAFSGEYSIQFNSYLGKNLEAVKIPGSYNIRSVQLSFVAFSPNAHSHIIIGVTTDASNLETYQPVDTIYLQNANRWERFKVNFTSYTDNGKYLTFGCDGTNIIFLDDIKLANPTCDLELPTFETFESYDLGTNTCWRNVTIPTSHVIDYNPTDTHYTYHYNNFYNYDTIYATMTIATSTFTYTGAAQPYVAGRGQHTIEVWGAQGGYNSSASNGGKGGYATGKLTITTPCSLYVYVGASGNTGAYNGGWNGGGARDNYYGGGGATDVRTVTGTWSLSNGLLSRIIVAGGGGSEAYSGYYGYYSAGGYGGGTSGGSSSGSYGYGGYGGTATGNSGGNSYITSSPITYNTSDISAGFGFGGYGTNYNYNYCGAGGGGWYGGTGSYCSSYYCYGTVYAGGGGSGYVYTAATESNYPAGCQLNSNYYLTDAYTTAGNQSFPSTTGATETGHTGNGFAKITYDSLYIDYIDSTLDHYTIDTILNYHSHSLVILPGTNPSFVVSPKILTNDLRISAISYDIYSSEEETVTLGTMTAQNTATSFAPMGSAQTQAHQWQHVTCTDLPDDLSGKYLAFKSVGARAVYIDNLDFSLALSINNQTMEPEILQVFPNPATNHIELKTANGESTFEKVEIYTIFGGLVKSFNNVHSSISVADLSEGVYILKAGNAIAKFIKH